MDKEIEQLARKLAALSSGKRRKIRTLVQYEQESEPSVPTEERQQPSVLDDRWKCGRCGKLFGKPGEVVPKKCPFCSAEF
jgi:rubrerythrin